MWRFRDFGGALVKQGVIAGDIWGGCDSGCWGGGPEMGRTGAGLLGAPSGRALGGSWEWLGREGCEVPRLGLWWPVTLGWVCPACHGGSKAASEFVPPSAHPGLSPLASLLPQVLGPSSVAGVSGSPPMRCCRGTEFGKGGVPGALPNPGRAFPSHLGGER